jgi:hypothetical protein
MAIGHAQLVVVEDRDVAGHSGLDDALKALRDVNVHRRDFTPSEAVAIGKRIEEVYRPKARGAMSAGGGDKKSAAAKSGGQILPTRSRAESKRTATVAAEGAGMSRETYRKAKAVVEAAVQQPDLLGPVVADMHATGKVDPGYRKSAYAVRWEPLYDVTDEDAPFLLPLGLDGFGSGLIRCVFGENAGY